MSNISDLISTYLYILILLSSICVLRNMNVVQNSHMTHLYKVKRILFIFKKVYFTDK